MKMVLRLSLLTDYMHMKKIFVYLMFCFALGCTGANAQVSLATRVTLDYPHLRFFGDESEEFYSEGFPLNVDLTLRFRTSEKFAFGIGTGYYRANVGDVYGNGHSIPLFLNLRVGEDLFLDANLGYQVPVTSTGIGFLSGFYSRIGLGISSTDKDPYLSLGAHVDLLHLFGSKVPAYVPNGYVPASFGYSIGLSLEYGIGLHKK